VSLTPGRPDACGAGSPRAFRRGVIIAARAAAIGARVLACAAFSCVVFFALLSIWGLVAAPFVRLSSASFVIVCALAASGAVTVAAYGALSRWLAKRRKRG